jgi:hypothetical protein
MSDNNPTPEEFLKEIHSKKIGTIKILQDNNVFYDGILIKDNEGCIKCVPTGAENYFLELDIKIWDIDINIKSKVFEILQSGETGKRTIVKASAQCGD